MASFVWLQSAAVAALGVAGSSSAVATASASAASSAISSVTGVSIMSATGIATTTGISSQPQPGLLFSDSLESGSFFTKTNGFGLDGVNVSPFDALVISTDVARTGTRSAKFTFTGGPAGDDAWSELRYTLGYNMSEVYIQWYQWYPIGTEGLGPKWLHRADFPDNNKFFKLWADNYTSYTITTGVSTRSAADGNSTFYTDWGTNLTGGVGQFGAAQATGYLNDSLRGRWVKFKFRVKVATAANNDGVIQMWVDDVLVLNNTTLAMYPSGGVGNHLRNGYIMGWANSGFDATSNTYIDDISFFGTDTAGSFVTATGIALTTATGRAINSRTFSIAGLATSYAASPYSGEAVATADGVATADAIFSTTIEGAMLADASSIVFGEGVRSYTPPTPPPPPVVHTWIDAETPATGTWAFESDLPQ